MAREERNDIIMLIDSIDEETSFEDPFEAMSEDEVIEVVPKDVVPEDVVPEKEHKLEYDSYTVITKYLTDIDIETLGDAIRYPKLKEALKYNPNELDDPWHALNNTIETLHIYKVRDVGNPVKEVKERVRKVRKKLPIKEVVLDFPIKKGHERRYTKAVGCPVRPTQLIERLRLEKKPVKDAKGRLRKWIEPLDPRTVEIDYTQKVSSDLRRLDLSMTAVHNIDNRAFQYYKLEEVVLNDYITEIGDHAFSQCVRLTSVRLPSKLTRLGDYAFYNCPLCRIDLPSTLVSIGGACFTNSQISRVVIPDEVTVLRSKTFKCCSQLVSVTLPLKLQRIGVECFFDCSGLCRITLPTTVIALDRGCFKWCTWLTRVDNLELVPHIGEDVFKFSGMESQRRKGDDN